MEIRDGYEWRPQSCPICGPGPTRFLGRRGGTAHRSGLGVESRIFRCRRCDLAFPDPMPVPVRGVEQHYELDPNAYFQHHDAQRKLSGAYALVKHAERLTGGKGRLLDIGSGRGEVLVAARSEGWTPVGIEPSAPFADYAERQADAVVRRMPIEACAFDAGSFDAVVLASVLEHLYNPDETMREIARVLRPGGVLYVDVPNETGLYFRCGNLYQRLRGRDWTVNIAPTFEPYHVFGFNGRSLRRLLAKYGLRVTEWRLYAGRVMLPKREGLMGVLEQLGARAATAASSVGGLGAYIDAWAVKE